METACYDPASSTVTPYLVSRTLSTVNTVEPDDSATMTADPDLVERAQAGDIGAFETLYRRHEGRVFALCLRMCGDRREAEERTQDAFVRAWEKLDSFHGRSAFSSWLHRLTVNVVLGSWRARGRRRERVVSFEDFRSQLGNPDSETDPLTADPWTTDASADRSPAGSQAGDRIDLERAIATLPAGARTVFVLYDIEGYRHPEIAEMTGLATGTCKAQLHRARQLLRKALGS